jgi:hypothetical protein
MRVDHFTDEGQAQTQPCARSSFFAVRLTKSIEHMGRKSALIP